MRLLCHELGGQGDVKVELLNKGALRIKPAQRK